MRLWVGEILPRGFRFKGLASSGKIQKSLEQEVRVESQEGPLKGKGLFSWKPGFKGLRAAKQIESNVSQKLPKQMEQPFFS